MAFNPFTGFRKYQKFWMASLILLSMVTFVMCSGIGSGGLEDLFLGILGRSHHGPVVATINGRAVYRDDLMKVKDQRAVANDYMHKAAETAFKNLQLIQKEIGKTANDKARQQKLTLVTDLLKDLDKVQSRPRYFGGGDKLDDLIDFYLWREQADRLGIRLQNDIVTAEVGLAVHSRDARMGPREWYSVQEAVRWNHNQATYNLIMDALRDEYRVQIAKLVLLDGRPYAFLEPKDLEHLRTMVPRATPTPGQLWDFYAKNRTPVDVALLPIPAEKFLAKARQPDRLQLESLFDKYKGVKYDPASPLPGFILPEEVKVTWVTADPKSDYYKNVARTLTALGMTPPVACPPPAGPGLGEALAYAGWDVAWQALLERDYEALRKQFPEPYLDTPLSQSYSALALYTRLYGRPDPQVAAAAVGLGLAPTSAAGLDPLALEAIAAPALWQAAAYQAKAGELGPVVEKEVARRWPVGATLVLSAADPLPLQTAALWTAAGMERQFLPFGAVESELRKQREHILAVGWTGEVMKAVRTELEADRSNGASMRLRLEGLKEKYPGLEVRETDRFRNRFDVAQDPSLAGFLKSFEKYRDQINIIEGRGGTERVLKDDDFYRLFFGGESFSVGNTGTFDPRVWPPVVTRDQKKLRLQLEAPAPGETSTINLWETAESPILFWKTESRPDQVPRTLAEARPQVERAYRLEHARADLALPAAKKAAEALRKYQVKDGSLLPEMEKLAAGLNVNLIQLSGITPLVPVGRAEKVGALWEPYQLPKGLFAYPTEDMAKEILSLRDLGAAIKVKEDREGKKEVEAVVRQLNAINAKLFDASLAKRMPGAHQIQILTNRPMTVFYVAAVLQEYPPDAKDFREVWLMSLLGRQAPGESLIDQAQMELGRDLERRFLEQLRRDVRDVNQKAFEGGEG